MKKLSRSEYIMMIILFILAGGYGVIAKINVVPLLTIIVGGGFLSKGASDFKKNNGGK